VSVGFNPIKLKKEGCLTDFGGGAKPPKSSLTSANEQITRKCQLPSGLKI